MLFERCRSYLKSYQSNKKFTEHNNCYAILPSFSGAHFELMFRGSLGISVFLGHIQKPVSLYCGSNQVVGFPMSCSVAGDIRLSSKAGSNLVNVFVK